MCKTTALFSSPTSQTIPANIQQMAVMLHSCEINPGLAYPGQSTAVNRDQNMSVLMAQNVHLRE